MLKELFTVFALIAFSRMKAEVATSENILHENMMRYEFSLNDSVLIKLHALSR
jgi:hypothetical protein